MPKSVIEIDVNDEKFKAFQEAFEKFQAALVDVNKTMKDFGKTLKDAGEDGNKKMKEVNKTLDDTEKKAKAASKQFKEQAKHAKDIAIEFGKISLSIAKWVAFSALGSGFGLGTIASSAANTRREALGLGLSPGALRAARANYRRYTDVEATLESISQTKNDPTKLLGYTVMGIQNPDKIPSGDLLYQVLQKGAQQFQRFGGNASQLQNAGILDLVSYDTLRRTVAEGPEALKASQQNYAQTLPRYEQEAKGFQVFMDSLYNAKEAVESSLIKSLGILTPALSRLTKQFTDMFDKLVSSEDFGKLMETVEQALSRFINYLGTPEFEKDVSDLFSAMKSLATATLDLVTLFTQLAAPFAWLADKLSVLFPKDNPVSAITKYGSGLGLLGLIQKGTHKPSATDLAASLTQVNPVITFLSSGNRHNPGNLRKPGSETEFQSFATDEAGLVAMARQLRLYQNRDKLNTLAGIISKYAPKSENNTAAYIANAASRTHYASDQALNLNDSSVLANVMSAMTKQENSKSNFTPQAIKVVIDNAPGSTVQASAAQLVPSLSGVNF